MKYILLLLLTSLAGCAQLQHGEIQPVIIKDLKNEIMYTTCSGAVERWPDCYKKAIMACSKGYKIIQENENAQGGIRELTFQCKK
jgi:hypothetical protein